MAVSTGENSQAFPNGSLVVTTWFSDGTQTIVITPAPAAQGGAMPPGYPAAYPGATVNPAP